MNLGLHLHNIVSPEKPFEFQVAELVSRMGEAQSSLVI